VVVEVDGITVYPAREPGDRWRAVWYEDGRRCQCQAISEERLAARLAKVTESVSDILCAGLFPVRYRIFIQYLSLALSDVRVPALYGGFPELDFPCCSGADAACPGFLPAVLVPGRLPCPAGSLGGPFRP